MEPRPILLVAEPLTDGGVIDPGTARALEREGYFLVRCPAAKMGDFRVVAPCPFVEADVELLTSISAEGRAQRKGALISADDADAIESIAQRIAGLLAFEAKRA